MHFRKHVAAALCAAIPALFSNAYAQNADSSSAPALTIDQAVTLAVRHNPTHLSVVNDRSSATALRKNAYGQLLPRFDAQLSGNFTKAGSAPLSAVQFTTQSDVYQSFYSLGLTYNLSWATFIGPSRQNANVRAADADIRGSEINVQATVTQDYLTVLQDQAKVILQDTLIAQAQLQLDLAKAKVAVGSGTQLDVSKAQVTLGQAQVAAIQAKNLVDVDKLRLFQEMGVPEPQNVQLTSQFVVEPPKFGLDSVMALARLQNPTLNALKVRTDVASLDVKSARGSYLPSLQVTTGVSGFTDQLSDPNVLIGEFIGGSQGCFGQDSIRVRSGLPSIANQCQAVTPQRLAAIRASNSQFPFNFSRQPLSVTATLSLPIFDNFHREQTVEQAEATRNDADYRAKAQELQLTADVTAAYLTLQAQVQTVTLQEQNAAQARQQLDLAEVKYKAGAATYLDISDAQATFSTAENDRINAIYQYHKAFAALEGAVGHPLR